MSPLDVELNSMSGLAIKFRFRDETTEVGWASLVNGVRTMSILFAPSISIRNDASRKARTVACIKEGVLITIEKEVDNIEAKVHRGRRSGVPRIVRASGELI